MRVERNQPAAQVRARNQRPSLALRVSSCVRQRAGRSVLSSLRLLLVLSVAGCGSGPSVPDELPKYSLAELKQQLSEVAETGAGGSALMAIEASLYELKNEDAAKSAELLEDFRKLERSPDAGERKKIARQMAEKL